MSKQRPVQHLPSLSPVSKMFVQKRGKALVVVPLKQMSQLMCHDVLKASHWCFRKLQIHPNPPGSGSVDFHVNLTPLS